MCVDDIIVKDAEVLYSFSRLNHSLMKSDVLLVLGNEDIRTARHAAQVYLEGWAPLVVVTGKEGTGTKGNIGRTEAELFSDAMISLGVPEDSIQLEKQATNTGENFRFSQQLLSKSGINPASVIVATKSVMELRAALTFNKQWEHSELIALTVTSPALSLQEFQNKDVGSMKDVVHYLISNFEKLTTYADLGYQAAINIPPAVWKAYNNLVKNLK